jgi:hypothetical protein
MYDTAKIKAWRLEMKNDHYAQTVKQLENNKIKNVLILSELTHEKLNELKKEYWNLYSSANEMGYHKSADVHYMKLKQVEEAIIVKMGNEAQAWDFLT